MEVDRRSFIKTVGVGAALGVGSVGIPTGNTWDQPGISADDLRPHVGQKFQAVCLESRDVVTMVLTDVQTNPAWERTHTGRPRPAGLRQPFTLAFETHQQLADGVFCVRHPDLKSTDCFVSRNDQAGRTLEICFS